MKKIIIPKTIEVAGICKAFNKKDVVVIQSCPGEWRVVGEANGITKLRKITKWYKWKMKMWYNIKKLIPIIAILLCSGCSQSEKDPRENMPHVSNTVYPNEPHTVQIIVLDSCEYILMDEGWHKQCLTHKGNCRLCKQRNKK